MAAAARKIEEPQLIAAQPQRTINVAGGPVAAMHEKLLRHYPPLEAKGGTWQVETMPMAAAGWRTRVPEMVAAAAGVLTALPLLAVLYG